jgi:glycosyltransferase involved in cell wall biosynthesis
MESSSKGPLVTIFVMSYNQADTIAEAAESALRQSYEPLEVIFSDDASTDSSFDILRAAAEAYNGPNRVILNRNSQNLGLVRHINEIMRISSGEFIVHCDGDDISMPFRVERLVEKWLGSGREVKLVHSSAIRIDAAGNKDGIRMGHEIMVREPSCLNIIKYDLCALGATAAWDRELYTVFGPLEEGLLVDDTILPFRAAILGRVEYVSEELIYWRTVGASCSTEFQGAWDLLFGRHLFWNSPCRMLLRRNCPPRARRRARRNRTATSATRRRRSSMQRPSS